MTFNEYQDACHETAIYPREVALAYLSLGLAGEAGELANKVKKIYRDHGGQISAGVAAGLVDELGDLAWYLAELARHLGYTLEEVAAWNIAKLRQRAQAGTLHGSGDQR